MKHIKAFISVLLISLIMISPISVNATAKMQLSEKTLKYYATVMGTTTDEIINLYNENDHDQFEAIIESMLNSRKYTDDMYNSENEIDTSNVTLSLSVKECSDLFGIDEATVNKHINICGINVYNKLIKEYDKLYNNDESEINVMSGGRSAPLDNMTDVLWEQICKNAHTGNILITKDSVHAGYRHGHVGIIQNHNIEPKYVTDAWSVEKPTQEVYCHPLYEGNDYSVRTTYWSKRCSLCLTYPNTPNVTDRERAGNQTWYYAEKDYYRYETLSTKAKVRRSDYKYMNCVGLPVRAYYFMASYDIVPHVGDNTMLLPSHVYYSANTRFKYNEFGALLRTPLFELAEWGWE